MNFSKPLIESTFIKRYKRFLVDAKLPNGEVITAHCPNTGSMLGLLEEGNRLWLTHNPDPKRKLKYTTEIIEADGVKVGINTSKPNALCAEAIEKGLIPHLPADWTLQREKKYGENSRIDILLTGPNDEKCFVEVKNVTLGRGSTALFPDAVTTRGTKHLLELAEQVRQGHRAVMFYLVQRNDCQTFSAAEDIDPVYAQTLKEAMNEGVEVIAWSCHLSPDKIELAHALTLDI